MQAKKTAGKKAYLILGLVMAFMLLLEICFAHPHHHRLWNVMPGADILLGFGGAWLLIFLGKIVMNRLLRRPENYYAAKKARDDMKNEQKAGGSHE